MYELSKGDGSYDQATYFGSLLSCFNSCSYLSQGPILFGFRQVNQGSILSSAHLLWESMWSCAIPHPKVVQSVPCTCSALEYQLHLGGYKQRTSLLNSGILDSTCVPSREEEEDRGEGHPTCEACRPYMHVLYKYYAGAFAAHDCGSACSTTCSDLWQ